MTPLRALGGLLGVVAAAAAVLSFAALRDLALLCGFARPLAWLLPVTVDAGAAAGTLAWMGGQAPGPARRFARGLALTLLGSSVAANALSHGLEAYNARPAWWVVVVVSGVAPGVLGACVHLAVLCGRDEVSEVAEPQQEPDDASPVAVSPAAPPAGGLALPPAPSRDELDEVLVADLRVVDAARRAAGLGPLPIGDVKSGIRERYGVGYPRGTKLRRAADHPHLVREDGDAS